MYACEYEVPSDPQMYRQVGQEIGSEPAKGLVAQLVVRTETGLRHTVVFEDAAAWERYRDERVEPAVARVLATRGLPDAPPPPAVRELNVVDVVVG